MKMEDHYRNLKESLKAVKYCVREGVEDNQRSLGFHTSVAATDMLEIYLHKNNLIDPGFVIKHDLFASKNKANDRLPEFEEKDKIIDIMVGIETKRNLLCYGKKQIKEVLTDVLKRFYEIEKIFEKKGVEIE